MPHKDHHLSDQDLTLAADGELPSRRTAEVFAHLDACPPCRERLQALEETLADFVRVHRQELDAGIPSAAVARAQLRARLAEAASVSAGAAPWHVPLWRAAGAFAALAVLAIVFGTMGSAEGPKPTPALTPGETRPVTIEQVCRNSQAEVITQVSDETRRAVFTEYAIYAHRDDFEVDYLITPDLGGSRSIRNLWPQPYNARWNARVKDRLEQRLHDLVCTGKVDLSTAQHDLAADWIKAYKKYFGTDVPQ
ncbi:MAG TPA: zf-HC2 domain-containing protein [Bryobacteraceae bacterium]|nr:zf-HC2 domain-containing protein [Bryobacteraceae bacterium]